MNSILLQILKVRNYAESMRIMETDESDTERVLKWVTVLKV
jgi:hypothetical protein